MIARIIRRIELDMARDLVKHPRIARLVRRMFRIYFAGAMFIVACIAIYTFITSPVSTGVPMPLPNPQVMARAILTNFGVLTPVAFYVLLHMRYSRWRWPVTGLVGLFAYPWFSVEVAAIWKGVDTLKVMSKFGPDALGIAASAAGLVVLFGFLERIFDLAENERARQQAQRAQ